MIKERGQVLWCKERGQDREIQRVWTGQCDPKSVDRGYDPKSVDRRVRSKSVDRVV